MKITNKYTTKLQQYYTHTQELIEDKNSEKNPDKMKLTHIHGLQIKHFYNCSIVIENKVTECQKFCSNSSFSVYTKTFLQIYKNLMV